VIAFSLSENISNKTVTIVSILKTLISFKGYYKLEIHVMFNHNVESQKVLHHLEKFIDIPLVPINIERTIIGMSRRLQIDKQLLSEILDGLEKKDLVKTTRLERKFHYEITYSGIERLKKKKISSVNAKISTTGAEFGFERKTA
jgi:hypothetical protein